MTQIQDGGGSGRLARVNADRQLLTFSVAEGPLEAAASKGEAAIWYSTFATGTTNVEVISIQNTEVEKHLHITRIILSASAITLFTIFERTSGTPGGTTVVYVNPNMASSVANANTAFGNNVVTGSLTGDTITAIQVLADNTQAYFFEAAIVLGRNDTLAITADVDSTVHVTVIGFWAED